jgi:hypothetical protein
MEYTVHMAHKDVGVRIRIEKELRDAFVSACHAQNRQASDVLRSFMRAFAAQNQSGRQADLFTNIKNG